MARRLLAVLIGTAALFALTVRADDPTAKPADPKNPAAPAPIDMDPTAKQGELSGNEKRIIADFEKFKLEVLKLKQRLETSDRDEDKQTAQVLQKVLTTIESLKVDNKLSEVDSLLKDPKTFTNFVYAKQVDTKDKELHEALQQLIAILDNLDDANAEQHKKIEANQKLLEQLKEDLSAQERLIAQLERNQKTGKELAKPEDKINHNIKAALDPNAKEKKADFGKSEAKYDDKPGPNAKSEAKNDAQGPKGETKDGKQSGQSETKPGQDKTGENKDGMKPAEAKGGANQDDMKPSDGKSGENKDGDKPGEAKDNAKSGENKGGEKPSEAKDGDKDSKAGAGKQPGDNKEAQPGQSKDGEAKDGKSGEAKDGANKNGKPSEAKDGKGGDGKNAKAGEGKPSTSADPSGKPGEAKEGNKSGAAQPKDGAKPGDSKPGDAKAGDGKADSKPGEGKGNEPKIGAGVDSPKPGDGKPGAAGDGKPGKPGDAKNGKPSDGKAGEGKPGEAKDGKPGDAKSGEGKPSDAKSGSDSKGKADGKADAKAGEPKPGMNGDAKPSESKGNPSQGQPSQGQPSQGKGDSSPSSGGDSSGQPQPPPPPPIDPNVRKKIEDGVKDSEETKNKLDQEDKSGAMPPADKTADDLKAAIKKLEEIINQDRQQEIDRILERLQARCARMLAMQKDVRDKTAALDPEVQDARKTKDEDRQRKVDQKSLDLSGDEGKIIDEADRALGLLNNDGTAVAFAEMFNMVKQDMVRVKKRLGDTDTGTVTVAIEDDIIGRLQDMVDALKKQREANKNKQNSKEKPPGPPKPPGEDPLVDVIAQLKLLRSMQDGLNRRTALYSKEYNGEQAPAPGDGKSDKERKHYQDIQDEMKDLSDTEAKISKILKDMLTGKNRVD